MRCAYFHQCWGWFWRYNCSDWMSEGDSWVAGRRLIGGDYFHEVCFWDGLQRNNWWRGTHLKPPMSLLLNNNSLGLQLTCRMVLGSAAGEGVSGALLSTGEGAELWDSWLAGCSGDKASLLSSSRTFG